MIISDLLWHRDECDSNLIEITFKSYLKMEICDVMGHDIGLPKPEQPFRNRL